MILIVAFQIPHYYYHWRVTVTVKFLILQTQIKELVILEKYLVTNFLPLNIGLRLFALMENVETQTDNVFKSPYPNLVGQIKNCILKDKDTLSDFLGL
jgi:hypothetical protein